MSADRHSGDADGLPRWWIVSAAILVALLSGFAGGVLALNAQRGHPALGDLSDPIVAVLDAPQTLKDAVELALDPTQATRAPDQRHAGESEFTWGQAPGAWADAPYLLINRYDGDRMRAVSDLVDLRSQDLVHTWDFDTDPFIADLDFESRFTDLARDKNTLRFQNVHAMLHADGSIVTLSHASPLMKFGPCGDLDWASTDAVFHHSIERDAEGFYWVPVHMEPQVAGFGGPMFLDDGIARVSPEGELVYARSLAQIFEKNGLAVYLTGMADHDEDPLHLNDIQPVLEDGELWRRGDLWLSMRNRSMVALYRPETDEILWWHIGPWSYQHDVDIVDDRRITVFDNAATRGRSIVRTADVSGKWIVDVVDNTFSRVQPEQFARREIRASFSALSDLLPDGKVMVEESPAGRLVIFDDAGTDHVTFVNRAEDGTVYALNWSRIVDRETGDAVRARLATGICDD